jgi:hypothetical protein
MLKTECKREGIFFVCPYSAGVGELPSMAEEE